LAAKEFGWVELYVLAATAPAVPAASSKEVTPCAVT
jgi:hypothetical protein